MNKHERYSYSPEEIRPSDGSFPEARTAGGFIVEEKRVLLEKRPDDANVYPGMWDTPGGHVEENETPEQALIRELDEELGIRPDRFVLGMVQDDRDTATGRFYRHFVYVIKEWEGEPRSREGRTVEWFSIEDVLELDALNPLVGFALKELIAANRL